MLELAYPWAFFLIPLPLLALWLLPPHREKVGAMRVPFFHNLVSAVEADARTGAVVLNRRFIHTTAMILVWLLLICGLAKPQWVGEPIVRTDASRDLMLAIDLSGSMDYRDFPGKDGKMERRLTAVQRVVDQFIAARDGDRVGLIVFGNKAYLQLPFTRDLETARALVTLMDVGMAGPQTAVGDGIGLAIRSFESSEVDQRLLILLTDGNDTASKMTPINAADVAKLNGVEIYTIGVGNPEASGEDRVDFGTLEAIAKRTGGQFFTADNETALAQVYARIDTIAPGEVTTQSWRPRESLVHVPVAGALLLALFAYAILLLPKLMQRPGRSKA